MSNKVGKAEAVPIFYKPLKNLSTSQGDCLVLECRVKGNPTPQIIWRREGCVINECPDFRMLQNGEIATLVIGKAFPEDTGIFSCEARNNSGTAVTSCKIVIKGGGKNTVSTKSPASFTQSCSIKSKLDTTAKHSHQSSKRQTHASHLYIIPKKPTSIGQKVSILPPPVASRSTTKSSSLSCVTLASYCDLHQGRSDSSSFTFHERFSKTDATNNDKALNTARSDMTATSTEVVSSPFPGRQEYKVSSFEQRLINEIEYRLQQIPPVCEDSDDERFEIIPFSQQINPIFAVRLKNFKAYEGTSVTLICKISAKPKAKVFWFKDGKQISKRSKHYIQQSDNKGGYELCIIATSMDDDGNYTAVACNPKGRASSTGRLAIFTKSHISQGVGLSAATEIIVASKFSEKGKLAADEESPIERYYRPNFLQSPPQETHTQEGKLVRFDVKVSGLPNPDIEWLINGKPVVQDSIHKILVRENNIHSLLLERVSPMDEGQYTIKAKNKAGAAIMHVQLHVEAREYTSPPAFIQRLLSQCVAAGDSVRLEARVVGTPHPKVCWKKGTDQIVPSNRVHLVEGDSGYVCMEIVEAHLSDADWYTCNATNLSGVSACNCKLDVYSPTSSAPSTRVRIKTPHRYANLARVSGVDFRETFSPDVHAHKSLPESEDL